MLVLFAGVSPNPVLSCVPYSEGSDRKDGVVGVALSGVGMVETSSCCSASRFAHDCFPCRRDGLYEHVKLFARHRSQTGCFLSHLTFATEQASQAERSLTGVSEAESDLCGACMGVLDIIQRARKESSES